MERISRYRGNNILVKNLDLTINDQRLREEFSKFGRITSVEVVMEGGSRSRGYGFICFASAEDATKAVQEMNGHVIGSKPVECTLAEVRQDRQAYLSALHVRLAQQQGHYSQRGASKAYIPTQRVYGPAKKSEINSPRWITQSYTKAETEPTPSCSKVSLRKHMISELANIEAFTLRGHETHDETLQGAAALLKKAPVTERALASFPPKERKNILGERLFPIIEDICHQLAGKITGMLLELGNAKIIEMLDNSTVLKSNVDEALAVLTATHFVTELADKTEEEI